MNNTLTSLTMPNSVTTIGADFFWGNEAHLSITLPVSVRARIPQLNQSALIQNKLIKLNYTEE
jgi:hypothetical protein